MHLCLWRLAFPWRSRLISQSLYFPSLCFLFSSTLTFSGWVWGPCLSPNFLTLQCYGGVNKSNAVWKPKIIWYWAIHVAELIIHQKSSSCGNCGEFAARKHVLCAETFPNCSSLAAECSYVWISAAGDAVSSEVKTNGSLPFSWRVGNPRSWTYLHLQTCLISCRWAEAAYSCLKLIFRCNYCIKKCPDKSFCLSGSFLPFTHSCPSSFRVTWLDFCGTSCVCLRRLKKLKKPW